MKGVYRGNSAAAISEKPKHNISRLSKRITKNKHNILCFNIDTNVRLWYNAKSRKTYQDAPRPSKINEQYYNEIDYKEQ